LRALGTATARTGIALGAIVLAILGSGLTSRAQADPSETLTFPAPPAHLAAEAADDMGGATPAKNVTTLAGDLDLVAFGRVVAELDSFDLVPAWRHLLQRTKTQDALCQRDCINPAWRRLIGDLRQLSPAAQLDLVQQRLNHVPYRDDMANWHQVDYWATPEEFLRKGGDCEDYAIAKYFALRAAGWQADDLRVMLSHRRGDFVGHAYLIVHLAGGWLVLDNRAPVPYRPAASVDDLWAGYSVNETSLWIHRNASAPDFLVSSRQ
jgi:predicted transglutaminase-like cysteine proteinase